MAGKLDVFNRTLQILQTRDLASLSDKRSERRNLDAVWNLTMDYMLEAGLWNFAARTRELQPSDSVDSNFGYDFVYAQPDDYVRLIRISANEDLWPTLDHYSEEGEFWLAWCDPLYVQYVSSAYDFGADPGKWPASFVEAFAHELAYRAGPSVTNMGESQFDQLDKRRKRALYNARGKDAVNQPVGDPPVGRLVRSRAGYGTSDHGRAYYRSFRG